MERDEIRDKLTKMLIDLGFTVAPMGRLPPNADWGLAVRTPPPTSITLNIIGLRSGLIVAGIGVMFSEPHRRAMEALKAVERVKLSAKLLRSIVMVCSTCRVGIHGQISQPAGVVAEVVLDPNTLTLSRLSDTLAMLINVFLTVNTILWEAFPSLHTGGHSQAGSEPRPETGFL